MILSYVYKSLAGVLHTLNKSYLDIKDIGVTYLTYFIFLISCYLLKNYFSFKFLNFIRIVKSSIVLIICLISLKYLDLNLTLSINFFYLYNILQLSNFLEVSTSQNKKSNNKSKNVEAKVINKYELRNENEEKNYELIGDTSKHLEKIAKKILNNKKKLEENECILKEKEIIDEIERKEKEEEEIMKMKNNLNAKKNKDKRKDKINLYGIYVFFLQTFYIYFFYFFWNYIQNLIIIKIFLTLQLVKCLISFVSNFWINNMNINLFKRMIHILDIVYMFSISLFFTNILYNISQNTHFLRNFAVYSIVFHVYYAYVLFVKYIYTYHKQFRSSLFSFILFFHVFGIIGMIKLYYHEYGKSLLIQVTSYKIYEQ